MTIKTTRAERAAISAAKLEKDIENCNEFLIKVVGPMYANMQTGGYADALKCSARSVKDKYGAKAKDCFELMFKLVIRGGITFPNELNQRIKYPSMWVANYDAVRPYTDWSQSVTREERTCKNLLKVLQEAEVQQMQWVKKSKTWVSKDLRDAVMASKRKADNLARPQKLSQEEIDEISAVNF